MGSDTIFWEEQMKGLLTETQFERFEKENKKALNGKKFGDYLDELIENKRLKTADVEKELLTYMSRSYFYECKNNTKNPSREIAIQMGIALGATEEEINNLLKYAGHSKLYVKDNYERKIIVGLQCGWDKERLYGVMEESKKRKAKGGFLRK